jgi:3-methyladenine DNA glycosylase/8-oxoguanine DNA glycosylase
MTADLTPDAHPHERAHAHLAATDPRLAVVLAHVGPCRLPPRPAAPIPADALFVALVEAIVGQQLSPKAADTIFARVRALVEGSGSPGREASAGGLGAAAPHREGPFVPTRVLALPDEALRAAGLSGAKTRGVKDLAARALREDASRLALDELEAMDDDAVIAALTEVRGIGRWTAEMVLMFQLGRPDVLPVGDLGVQKGFQRLFRLRERPKPDRMEAIARPFRPFRSILSWYAWRVNELPDEVISAAHAHARDVSHVSHVSHVKKREEA